MFLTWYSRLLCELAVSGPFSILVFLPFLGFCHPFLLDSLSVVSFVIFPHVSDLEVFSGFLNLVVFPPESAHTLFEVSRPFFTHSDNVYMHY